LLSLLGGIVLAAQAISFIAPLHGLSVCLSVVCHIRAPCSKRSVDLHPIWQTHLWGPMTHCPWPPGELEFLVAPPAKTCIANCSQTLSPMQPTRIWVDLSQRIQRFRLLPNYLANFSWF